MTHPNEIKKETLINGLIELNIIVIGSKRR